MSTNIKMGKWNHDIITIEYYVAIGKQENQKKRRKKKNLQLHTQQQEGIPQTLCWVKEARHKTIEKKFCVIST